MGWHQDNEPKIREILWAQVEEFPPLESLEQPRALPPSSKRQRGRGQGAGGASPSPRSEAEYGYEAPPFQGT